MEQRENAIKAEFKKKDEKIHCLEIKLRKILEKNDKTEYKNNFEVFQPLMKDSQSLSMVHKECDALFELNIKTKLKTFEKENSILKGSLKQIFDQLFRLS